MIDPILSLSFGMHSIKGAYALLLGSGVSRSAGIPTGWEVVLDLIRKLPGYRARTVNRIRRLGTRRRSAQSPAIVSA